MKSVTFRFYEELNDFLPYELRKRGFTYSFSGNPTVKDAIEALGIPHPEVDLIIIDKESVGFNYHLTGNERIAVYPVIESLDIQAINHLRPTSLREIKFIVDNNLGKLARYIRLLGFDTIYDRSLRDKQIVLIAVKDKRIILSRNKSLLKCKDVNRGYWVRSQFPDKQIKEIIKRFDIRDEINLLSRCTVCNGVLHKIDKQLISDKLEPMTKRYFSVFMQCEKCKKIYWKGSHYKRIQLKLKEILDYE